jgi:signal transduction histidine kinase
MYNLTDRIRNTTIKSKIILIFSVITVILVGVTARVSYVFVKEIYQRQLEDQVNLLSSLLADELELKYLNFIESDENNLAYKHYKQILTDKINKMQFTNGFIFNQKLQVLVSANKDISTARLMINRKEINELARHESSVSLPFKDEDDKWRLWGFYRLNEQYYLGVQENADRLEKLDYLSWLFFAIGFGGILITIIAGWLLARTIARPINELVQFSAKIGDGQFNAQAPKRVHGELAILKNALIKMRYDLALKQEEKEELLAQIAHEIRNPLGGIELLAGLIKEDSDAESKNTDYIQKILDEVHGLKSQITAYLYYSRPLQAEPERVQLNNLYAEIEDIFKKRFQEKNIQFSCENLISSVWFDKRHLRQIVTNLLSNSSDAVKADGKIHIKSFSRNTKNIISVSDDGSGIKLKNPAQIFAPFYTTRKNGTGLGLSVCKKLCEENRADISAQNNKDKGCTFEILMQGRKP